MTESPFSDQGDAFTVTLKYGKGFEDPWLVIRGGTAEDTKRRVIDAVGLEGAEDLTLAEVIVNAKSVVQGASAVATQLGGTAIPSRSSGPAEQAPAAAPEPEPAKSEGPTLIEQIDKLGSKREGQQFYLANRSAIDADPTAKAAITEKMKTLS